MNMPIVNTAVVSVGSRVSCSLPYGGRGIVSAIEGEQNPGAVRVICVNGVRVTGGSTSHFSVVFEAGNVFKRVSESILRGPQWRIHDEIATPEELAAALVRAENFAALKKTDAEAAEAAYIAEVSRLASAPEFAKMKQGDDLYSGKLAAGNLRIELKKAFPAVKFSVRMDSYGSVRIGWTDGPTQSEVEALAAKYKGGTFDGMEDLYRHEKSPWTAVFGGAKYVFPSRATSLSLLEKAIEALFSECPEDFQGVARPSAEEFKNGDCYRVDVCGENLQTLIHRKLGALAA